VPFRDFCRDEVVSTSVTQKTVLSGIPARLPGGMCDENASDLRPIFAQHDAATAAAAIAMLARDALGTVQLPSTRQYMEICMIALARRFPQAALTVYVEPWLSDFTGRPQQSLSCVTVASDLCRHLARAGVLTPKTGDGAATATAATSRLLARSVLDALLPYAVSPIGICRAVAQVALHDAAFMLYPRLVTLLPPVVRDRSAPVCCLRSLELLERPQRDVERAHDAGALALAPYVHMISQHPGSTELIAKQRKNLERLDPRHALTMEAILCSPVTEHGEIVPIEVLPDMKAALTDLSVRLHSDGRIGAPESEWLSAGVRWAIGAGILPRQAAYDERLREGFVVDEEQQDTFQGLANSEVATDADRSSIFQRKILSAASSAEALQQHVDMESSGLPHLSPVLTELADGGRPCQPFVMVASLVNRVPNLGGLARTCEIFGGEGDFNSETVHCDVVPPL
jgi:hypothetical protein